MGDEEKEVEKEHGDENDDVDVDVAVVVVDDGDDDVTKTMTMTMTMTISISMTTATTIQTNWLRAGKILFCEMFEPYTLLNCLHTGKQNWRPLLQDLQPTKIISPRVASCWFASSCNHEHALKREMPNCHLKKK